MKNAEEQIRKHLRIFKNMNSYYWIAGGSIMSFFLDESPNDVDFFFKDEGDADKAIRILLKKGFRVVERLDFGKKLSKDNIEYDILHTEKTPEDCIMNFDISVCCAAIDSNGVFYYHEKYFEHVGEKRLEYLGNYPSFNWLCKSLRLKKYLKMGFEISRTNLISWLNKQESDQKMFWKNMRKGASKQELSYMKPPNKKKFQIKKQKLNIW